MAIPSEQSKRASRNSLQFLCGVFNGLTLQTTGSIGGEGEGTEFTEGRSDRPRVDADTVKSAEFHKGGGPVAASR